MIKVVLCSSYSKDPEGLLKCYNEFSQLDNCQILSPKSVKIDCVQDDFIYMVGDNPNATPLEIELEHLKAIESADFVWIHAPNGYIGPSTSFEIGVAWSNKIPMFTNADLQDPIYRKLINVVDSSADVVYNLRFVDKYPPPTISGFQKYYWRMAEERKYTGETPKDCLFLMIEEIGELARAIRKTTGLKRYHEETLSDDVGLELADVYLYLMHLANLSGVDVYQALSKKEEINHQRFINYLNKKE